MRSGGVLPWKRESGKSPRSQPERGATEIRYYLSPGQASGRRSLVECAWESRPRPSKSERASHREEPTQFLSIEVLEWYYPIM